MGNKIALFVLFLLVVGFGLFLIKDSPIMGNVIGNLGSGGVQEITIGMKNYNYNPNTIKVNVNQPVRIYLDETVRGCYRSLVIKDFGVYKNFKDVDDYVEFTPNKKGTYRFSCSMGMGVGTLIVK
ncbi:cupredoxin domain-containing protein [Candidatus Pacearchaeota archaeon]|nr:cupredoxin domain-containing protein [Candidatus Pacearchaeota archaeon]